MRKFISAVAILAFGCAGGDGGSTVPVTVATVSISPPNATVYVGETQQLTASALDANGSPLIGRTVSAWTSSDAGLADVTTAGTGSATITARAIGTARITAVVEGKSGLATLTLLPAPVASVAINPQTANVPIGSTQQFAAITVDARGTALLGRVLTWTSNNQLVATVSPSGLVTAMALGSATITVTSEGKTASAIVTTVSAITGTWSGFVGSQRLSMTVIENAGVITGTGTITNTTTGTRALTTSGTFIGTRMNLTFTSGSIQPFNLQATVSGRTMTGTLTGSGFVGDAITLIKE